MGITRILAVDGDKDVCNDIQTLMKDTEVQTDIAFCVEDAMELLWKGNVGERYQAILLDWNVVNTDGIGIMEKIREITPVAVPILFMTEYDEEGMEEVLRMANTEVLTKPFFVSAFKEKISELQEEEGECRSESVERNNLEGLYFLAAEDNEINAEILSEILDIEGAGCEIVGNGRLALERFMETEEGRFDAILMDVQMPVMNGYDATRAIRQLERSDARKIPIIAMTANAFAEDEKEALDAGMDVHMAKPIDIELLKRVIRQQVKERN